MGFWDRIFNPKLKHEKYQTFQELGTYKSVFNSFGGNIYASELVRACIRPLAEITSKANARCTDESLERLLNESPNQFMNGKDFLAKVRNILEIKNTSFIMIYRDDRLKVTGLYPVPYSSFVVLQDAKNRLFVEFSFNSTYRDKFICPVDDLAILRKDYVFSDIAGEDNTPVLQLLEVINTTNQGVANAVKATSNLRGILKSTKAMLSADDVKKQKDQFVADYLSLENEGGIASLDSTQEFIPITMNPTVTNAEQMREFREDLYRYFGVNDDIVMSKCSEAKFEFFYENRIEPFLVALSLELTRKIFSSRQLGFGNKIVYESNRLQFASTATKLNLVSLVDRGALTPNEWRMTFNLAPIEGGDKPIRRLDTEEVNENNMQKQNEASGEEDSNE